MREQKTKDLSTHLIRDGEELNHLLFHQFFILGLKRENIKLKLKKVEKDKVSWNLYQMEIILLPNFSARDVKDSLEKEIRLSFPDFSLQFWFLKHGEFQLTIQQDEFPVSQLTFIATPTTALIPGTKPGVKGKIALIIDDLGPNLSLARAVLAIDFPITFSILPFYIYSKEIAKEAHSLGREVILHLPLEPRDNENRTPEKGTLYTWMDEDRILDQLREDLSAIPYVSGVNGHMGSRFTEDRKGMEVMLKEIKSRGLYFLDSFTTGHSTGSAVARDMGVRFGKRDFFLDRSMEESTIEDRLLQLSELSKKRGYAIGIAHSTHDTIDILKKMLPLLSSEGIEVVPLSQIIYPE